MSNTDLQPIRLASGSALSTGERAVEWLDRITNPFGQGRTQFESLRLAGLSQPELREVRISMVEGNVPADETQDIDSRVRVLVSPDRYDSIVAPHARGQVAYFVVVSTEHPWPYIIAIERVSYENRGDGMTFKICGARGSGDRPAVLAYFAGLRKLVDDGAIGSDTGGESLNGENQ